MPEENFLLVSVVVAVYNGEKYIQEAIDSVLNQDYPKIELIVIDDGSTDNTANILSKYTGKLYWETHSNMGQANTLNKGWQMAHGEVLAYLGADDALLPSAVSKSVEYLLEYENVILTYGDYYLMDAGSEVIQRVYAPDYNYHDMVVKTICPPGPGVFFRREGFESTGFWDPSLHQMPDFDYWIRLGLNGRFLRIPEPLAKFRVHEESQSYAESDEIKSDEIVRVMNRYFQLDGIPPMVLAAKSEALSNAKIIAARLHLRAGRYRLMLGNLASAWRLNFRCLFTLRTVKLLMNGILYRIKKMAF